ncbi:hypothetical protein GOODEAATRI_007678 [Goodea atripinnis]|uniref:Uncharacterized protein n=1 Tax=Goodea atripinnis TaxID=208336 RepID=A0ABV0PLQ4_9TELE
MWKATFGLWDLLAGEKFRVTSVTGSHPGILRTIVTAVEAVEACKRARSPGRSCTATPLPIRVPIGQATGASSRSTLVKAAKIIAHSGHGYSPGPELTELPRELPEPSFPPILGGSPSRSRGSGKGYPWSSTDWNSELEALTEIPSSSRSSPDSQAVAAWKAGVGCGALSRALSCSNSALRVHFLPRWAL